MGSIQWAEIRAPCRHPERRLPESKDLTAAIFAAVMMSHFPRAQAFIQGLIDAIRKTHLFKSPWEVWSSGTLSLRSGRQDLATHSSNASVKA